MEERNELRQAVMIKTSSFQTDKVQESGTSNFDDKYMKFIEVSEDINEQVDKIFDLRLRVSNEIDRLEKPEHRIILRMRYINLKTFEEIAVKMNYDIRQVTRLHGNALQEFEKDVLKCPKMSYR